jgi:hypothetical protein
MARERYEQDRGREGRGGEGRRRRRVRGEGGAGQRTQQRFEEEDRFRERLRGPGSWAGLEGDYGQEPDEAIGYEEPRGFAGGRYEDDRSGGRRDEDFGYYGGQGRGSRRSTAGSYYEEPGYSGPGQRNRFGDRGEFGSGEDWQQPRYLSGSYDEAAGRGFGSSEQEQAWVAGGGAERWGGGQQQRSGTHAGKGPKGYQRSDERVLEDVCEALERHPRIDASEIEVTCSQGEITLRGSVDSRQTRRLAEEAIEELPGVRDVHNELRAQSQMQHGVSETGGGRLASRQDAEGNRGRS